MMNTNESGRSMVEMLGVLAIIGVLSIGGIAGYTQAMKKYKVNEAVNIVSMAAVMCGTGAKEGVSALAKTGIVTNLSCSGDEATFTLDGSVDAKQFKELLTGATDNSYNALS